MPPLEKLDPAVYTDVVIKEKHLGSSESLNLVAGEKFGKHTVHGREPSGATADNSDEDVCGEQIISTNGIDVTVDAYLYGVNPTLLQRLKAEDIIESTAKESKDEECIFISQTKLVVTESDLEWKSDTINQSPSPT